MKPYLLNTLNTFIYNQQKPNIKRIPQITSQFEGIYVQIKKLPAFEVQDINTSLKSSLHLLEDDCYEVTVVMEHDVKFQKQTFYLAYSKGLKKDKPLDLNKTQHNLNGQSLFIYPENHIWQLEIDHSSDTPSVVKACDELDLPYIWSVYITNSNSCYGQAHGYSLGTYEQSGKIQTRSLS